ncbi:hypothetical protein P692DRAFT_20798874 [Suillus brevipes Sb2]|nr:hypothetical protein P692DRAFT_20798874 [Suillus brevipes Sb2]
MNNNGAHSSLPTPNTSASSSSTNNTPVVPNTVQGPAPQHGALTFGTPAEQEGASRPRRDLGLQRARLRELRARQQGAAQRAQSQLRTTQAQPALPLHHGPQPVINPPNYPPPQPQPQPLYHQQAHPPNVPAVPNPNFPQAGPPPNALNGIANENAGFGVRNGPQGMPAPMWNAGVPPPIPNVPQGPMYPWAMYGYPAPQHHTGNPGPHAHGVAPFAAPYHGHPANVPHPPVHWPRAAPYHPQPPPLGPVEGGSTRGSKRKAVDADDVTGRGQKRHRPQDDPNFEPAQPGPDGKARWKCLKQACVKVKPMLEYSVHKHVTQTNSHQADSSESLPEYLCSGCGETFKRPDALKRHKNSGSKCVRNRLQSQASSSVLGNSALTAGPSSSGSVTQQSMPLPAATPDIVQAVGSSTSVAAAPVVMPQRQFTFQARGPAPSSAEVQPDIQASKPQSVQPPSGDSAPIIAGDFSFSIFRQAAPSRPPLLPPSSHSPSEEVGDDSSADLFSAPPSPTPSEDASESECLFSAPPSPPG